MELTLGSTGKEVEELQHIVGAHPDGEFGPETQKAVNGWLRIRALYYARTQIGISEEPKGSNWGSRVAEYLRAAGYGSPQPWCAAFVYWCFQQAASELGVKNPVPKTGYCPTLYAGLQQRQRPAAGDLFFVHSKSLGRLSHVGFVEAVGESIVQTIEGNTNDEGDREGYEVCRRKREKAKLSFAGI